MVLFVNPLTPRVKTWVIQSFLTFDSMDTMLKCDHSLETVLYCGAVCVFNFTEFVNFVNLLILELALSGVKGVSSKTEV